MATDIMGYANRHTARARNRTSGGTSSIPVSGRHAPTLDIAGMMGKTAPKGGAGGLESRQIPAAIQEAGPEAMSVEGGEASMQPQMVTETQQPIENRGGSARYMIQGGGPRIDLSFLVPERANKAFDPSKAIGGENVPFQESKGVGGFFRRMLGDESNQQNIAAQQAQGAEWRQEAKELKAEERLLNRMREGDKPAAERFNRQLEENKIIRGEESATRARERGEDTATRTGERAQDRADRLARETEAEKARLQERQDRLEQQLQENALRDATFGQNQLRANQPSMTGLPGGGMGVFDPSSRSISIVNPGTAGFGNTPGTAPTTRQVYPPPQFKPSGSGGGQVDRGTGATMGGALNEPSELPPGGGVRMGGALPPPPQNTALLPRFGRALGGATTEAINTVGDPLRAAGTELYKTLLSSQAMQDPEVLARMKLREEASRNATVPRFQNIQMGY